MRKIVFIVAALCCAGAALLQAGCNRDPLDHPAVRHELEAIQEKLETAESHNRTMAANLAEEQAENRRIDKSRTFARNLAGYIAVLAVILLLVGVALGSGARNHAERQQRGTPEPE